MTAAPDQLLPFDQLPYPLNLLSRRHLVKQAGLGRLGPCRVVRMTPHSPPMFRKKDVDAYVLKLLSDSGVPE